MSEPQTRKYRVGDQTWTLAEGRQVLGTLQWLSGRYFILSEDGTTNVWRAGIHHLPPLTLDTFKAGQSVRVSLQGREAAGVLLGPSPASGYVLVKINGQVYHRGPKQLLHPIPDVDLTGYATPPTRLGRLPE
jgi:hypothetical protein